ncbi:hypothetical protein [Flocculibacter collagenilyticus]|uniref:hypothetical protein n=1 Tax=Flocculibacter collagenilyticus TaxID=2744479 RepID=UPI0018F723F2|nr:hypothetical protein [Flocculibacter collagenilyticus]
MFKKIISLSLILFSASAAADGLLRTTNLKKYCAQDGVHRQTIIYLDQGIIARKDPNWYKDILNKTKFLPGERIQVVTIKSGGSTVEQAWDSCYPSYTKEKYQQLKKEEGFGSMFTGGVDENMKNDVKSFTKWFKQALAHPLQDTKHETPPSYASGNFPDKKLVEALYYDAKRMDLENGISRVIIFSDMMEKSDLLDQQKFEPAKRAEAVAKRFPMFLNHASIYVYGINYTNQDTALNEKMQRFWEQYLLTSGAHLEQYGTQLVLPRDNKVFDAHSYSGKLTQSDGKKLATSMRLAYSDKGELVHSWVTISDHYLPISGTLNCSGQNCTVLASIEASTFDGFEKKDVLKLSGSMKALSGSIGARDDSVIDEQGKIYRFDVEYAKDKNLSL